MNGEKLIIISKNSLTKRLALISGISLASIFFVYSLPRIVTTLVEESRYQERVRGVEKETSDGNFELAEKLLQSYEDETLLDRGAILKLEFSINEKRQATEEVKKLSLENSIDETSEENLLKKIRTSVGKEKINLIEKFNKIHPQNELVNDLKQEELEAYFITCESYFITNSGGQILEESLRDFYAFLANNKQPLNKDFSEFLRKGEEYIRMITERNVTSISSERDFQVGDLVIIKKSLGNLNGYDEKKQYFNGWSLEDFAIGSEGMITRIFEGSYGVKVNGYVAFLVSGEIQLKKSVSEENLVNQAPLVQQYLTSIKQLVEEQR